MSDVIKWPGWRYHPETGVGEIFQSEDEVPEGWLEEVPDQTVSKEEQPEDDLTEADEESIKDLLDGNTQAELVAMLELMNEDRADDDQIEFLASWPKRPLAVAIHAAGGE